MNRSEREKREAEREARRTKRLSERATQRAKRQAKEAEQAAERAKQLARRARHRRSPRHRDLDRSIEDLVDEVTDKWSRKAESWMGDQSRQMFGSGSRADSYSDDQSDMDDDFDAQMDDEDYSDLDDAGTSRRSRRKERPRGRRAGIKAARGSANRWKRRNRNGNLYRDSKNKKICGVCSGIADYWGMETWQVRMMAVFALFIVPSVAVPGYFIAYFLMDDKPYYKQVTDRFHELDDEEEVEAFVPDRKPKRKADRSTSSEYKVSNVQNLRSAKQKFADIEERLRSMESHVTSPKFELQRELRKIAGDEA
ncbi:MAG: phage shock protein C [Patiriisocius sp.]